MQLSEEQEKQVLEAVTAELVERAWAKLETQLEDITCITVPRLAGMLELSTERARKRLRECVDFGPRETRVTLKQARELVEEHKVRLKPKGGRRAC